MSTPIDRWHLPPEASPTAAHLLRRLMRPIDRFLRVEAASGIVLLVAAATALAWANSPWARSYTSLWQTPLHIGAAGATVDVSLQFIVNDILMAVFFLVVGLEIRRELHHGELSSARRAALPALAAVGGMIAPALTYLVTNPATTSRGWGVPMATDIAFAVGVLALLGSRVVPSMRVFLLAVAIIDDVGSIIVIAVFYSTAFDGTGLVIAAIGAACILILQRFGARHAIGYALPAAIVWVGIARAGVHPAIAGVIVGLLTPPVAWYGPRRFMDSAHESVRAIAQAAAGQTESLSEGMRRLRHAQREVVSPVERLESTLHPWVAYAVMPLFAFANAGVELASVDLSAGPNIMIGIVVGLVIGKPLGIIAASALAVRLRVAALPNELTWRRLAVVGMVAGIGFTMALFLAELAFVGEDDTHAVAKVAVLVASTIAAIGAVILARMLLPSRCSLRSRPASEPSAAP